MLEDGEELAVVSRTLGHSQIATTADVYPHPDADHARADGRKDGWRPDPSQEGVGRLTVVRRVVRAKTETPGGCPSGVISCVDFGWRARIRTWNPLIQSQVLYR